MEIALGLFDEGADRRRRVEFAGRGRADADAGGGGRRHGRRAEVDAETGAFGRRQLLVQRRRLAQLDAHVLRLAQAGAQLLDLHHVVVHLVPIVGRQLFLCFFFVLGVANPTQTHRRGGGDPEPIWERLKRAIRFEEERTNGWNSWRRGRGKGRRRRRKGWQTIWVTSIIDNPLKSDITQYNAVEPSKTH